MTSRTCSMVFILTLAVVTAGCASTDATTPPSPISSVTSSPNTGHAVVVLNGNYAPEEPWWQRSPDPTPPKQPPGPTTVTAAGDLLFAFDSSQLTDGASTQLQGALALINVDLSAHITIDGYTDGDGEPNYNVKLSERRAAAVADWLVSQGVDRTLITTVGHGAADPIALNDTAEAKSLNRRVTITIGVAS